ncbi:hypothetical protein MGN70_000404 [Eutypa lata]|uniref:Uncharacterized protein n=1 Tax=Eutypa lata (strain UCR-EL1) TaxID=1287681 RepID=M7SZ33_EUTLA|nr:hypothetical protein UCREL1_10219 [Eutypa lata UCREL1]KAI1257364.1 hypothetical protein MGN70_000404 [Eutypa lata]
MSFNAETPSSDECYTWPDLRDSKFSGSRDTAALRSQLLSSPSSASPRPPPCKACLTVLGRINCTHISAAQCASLKARKKKQQHRAGVSKKGKEAMQVYACPGRHAFVGTRALGGRSISPQARAWKGDRELLAGMCPHCWSEAINDGYRGGRRRWTQASVTLRKKEARKSKQWVMDKRIDVQLKQVMENLSEGESESEGDVVKVKKAVKVIGKAKNWKFLKGEETRFRMKL